MDEVNRDLRAADSLPDGTLVCGDGGRCVRITQESEPVLKLSGRDAYIQRLTRTTDDKEPEDPDEEPDEEEQVRPDGEPLSGRDAYLARLPGLCDDYSRDYQRRLDHRTVVRMAAMSVVTQFLRRQPPAETPPDSLSQRIHDAGQSLASDLRQFRTGWSHFPRLAQFELVVSDDLLAALNRLSAEFERNHYVARRGRCWVSWRRSRVKRPKEFPAGEAVEGSSSLGAPCGRKERWTARRMRRASISCRPIAGRTSESYRSGDPEGIPRCFT